MHLAWSRVLEGLSMACTHEETTDSWQEETSAQGNCNSRVTNRRLDRPNKDGNSRECVVTLPQEHAREEEREEEKKILEKRNWKQCRCQRRTIFWCVSDAPDERGSKGKFWHTSP